MSALRCIVVDDEPLACDLIAGYVRQTPFLELVRCYTNALSVIDALHSDANIDLLFLDIQMPQLSGMELSRLLPERVRVIFITHLNSMLWRGFGWMRSTIC
jgi:two-component system LytT family response regulator